MTKLLVEVHDQTKEQFLRELLAALPYVTVLSVERQSNGATDHDLAEEAEDYNPFYQDPRQAQMENEVAAFEEQHSMLVAHYLGEFVAMYQGQVIDHDLDQRALLRRVRSTHPDQVILFRRVEESLQRNLIVHSVRFV